MKSICAYLLLSLLVITSSIKAADAESSASASTTEVTNEAFTQLLDRCENKKLPSKWERDKSGKWRNLNESAERVLSTFVIFGSDKDTTPLQQRSLNIYHFAEEIPKKENQPHYFEPMKDADGAERIFSNKHIEKIIQVKNPIKRCYPECSRTKAPKQSPHKVFKPDGKLGYSSRLLNSFLKESKAHNVNQCASLTQKLSLELQKEVAVFNARFRNLALQEKDAAILQEKIKTLKCAYSDDFISKLNALIDDIRQHAQNKLTHQEAIEVLFQQGNDDGTFALLESTIKTTNKDASEHVFDFYSYCKKSGRIPAEEYAEQAPDKYASWWFKSLSDVDEAKELRTLNAQITQTEKSLETADDAKKEVLLAQLNESNEKRAELFEKIKQDVFEQAKQATMAQLAVYSQRKNDKERLTYRESYIAQEKKDISDAQQNIAHTLLYLTAQQRADGMPTTQAISNIVACDKQMIATLAEEVDLMNALIKTTDDYTEIGK